MWIGIHLWDDIKKSGTQDIEDKFGLFGYFVPGGSPTLFGLGRGPITPPDPAMVQTDRKDLNSKKKILKAYLSDVVGLSLAMDIYAS